jgi:choline dehydrogenase-like flavoprotein
MKTYDVCIVGSGAAGGAAAKVLTDRGFDVVMLEAGPTLDVAQHYTEHKWTYSLLHRGLGVGGSGYDEAGNRELDVEHIGSRFKDEPYTSAPDSPLVWTRARLVGGRTNHWNRVALRFSEADFRQRSLTGLGSDWPITYQELAPYYEKVERFIGVYGTAENIPSAPDGFFQPPPKPRCADLAVQAGAKRLGIPCIPGRAAIITQPLNGRPPCHYCGQCTRGCRMHSAFSSGQTMIPQAIATGKLKVIPFAMAREITVRHGKASGVTYIDKNTRRENHIAAKAVVLGASTCESARLLLNSRSAAFPNGLANSSGVVGRYLMDSSAHGVTAYIPALSKLPPHDDEGTGSVHVYIPWWKYDRKNDFAGGYHVEVYTGRQMPSPTEFRPIAREFPQYGISLKQKCREIYGTVVSLAARGEMIPDERSYCEIDPNVRDKWGIPVLRFHFKWGDNERAMAKDMNQNLRAVAEAAGGKVLGETGGPDRPHGYLSAGGVAHELGTVRMGLDPKTSVLNGYCQAHEVKNLFVTDGACFTTNPDKNPTISITALSWRAAEHLADEARKGSL